MDVRNMILDDKNIGGNSSILRIEKAIGRELTDKEIMNMLIYAYNYIDFDISIKALSNLLNIKNIIGEDEYIKIMNYREYAEVAHKE